MRYRGTHDGYHNSVAAVVVAVVDEAVVTVYVADVTVPEDVNKKKEGEGAADKVRQ